MYVINVLAVFDVLKKRVVFPTRYDVQRVPADVWYFQIGVGQIVCQGADCAGDKAEARVLMLSANNIKLPAHGRPLTVPTQDMIIGLYYLTAARDGFEGEGRSFIDFDDAMNAYDARAELDLQAKIWVRLTKDTQVATAFGVFEEHKAGERIETTIGRITFNNVLPEDYPYLNYEMNKKEISRLVEDVCNRYELSSVPPILDGLKDAGFHYATRAGVTV